MEPGTTAGAQTLARGLSALEMVATAENGMTVQEVAERLGVHRTIASRLLGALARHRLIARDAGGRYRVGSGLIALARQYEPVLKTAAGGVLRRLADKAGATALVTVHDGDSAVAVAVAEPAWSPAWSTVPATARRSTAAPPPMPSAPSSRPSRASRRASRRPAATSTPSPTARSPPGPTASPRPSRAPPASAPPASC